MIQKQEGHNVLAGNTTNEESARGDNRQKLRAGITPNGTIMHALSSEEVRGTH